MWTIQQGISHHIIMNDETPVAIVPFDFLSQAERIVRCVNAADEATRLLIEASLQTDPDLTKRINACVRKMTK